jgi:hypothetical protein
VLEGVHPERFVTTDVDPSLTVALQVLDRYPEALNLNAPLLLALPVAVDSGDETVIVALAFAPRPSTVRFPDELSEAFRTLTFASAPEGAIRSVASVRTETKAAIARPRESFMLERIIASSLSSSSFQWLLRHSLASGFHI